MLICDSAMTRLVVMRAMLLLYVATVTAGLVWVGLSVNMSSVITAVIR